MPSPSSSVKTAPTGVSPGRGFQTNSKARSAGTASPSRVMVKPSSADPVVLMAWVGLVIYATSNPGFSSMRICTGLPFPRDG